MPEKGKGKGKGRRRGRVEMKRIENQIRRQITFSKRKAGLLKKVAELSLLCDVDLALIISSPSGKLYHSPAPNIDRALGRYQRIYASSDYCAQDSKNMELLQQELEKRTKIETELERSQKNINGEDLDCLSFEELQHLEKKMKIGVTKIRSTKERLLRKYIRSLKAKVRSELGTTNRGYYTLELKTPEVDTDHIDLEGGNVNVTVDDHQQPHQRDGDASPETILQYHTNLSLSLF